ncbi:hypothetical protein AJ79_05315 [Helicocarpus griseus UAMH5409]|uniref:Methionine permease n=1 Tax=Helicocarpus griseus UAMH5409 TaxID=1447875 RepID=A0A2B7XG71_9EURO|nr:hypothetical protein AJ79_05315 [Helicocarpus griseus UAMH5409]
MAYLEPHRRPLLAQNPPGSQRIDYDSIPPEQDSVESIQNNDLDSLFDPSIYGSGTLSRTSAYIIVISRIIGTGIFATPGIIAKSVGSIGLSLSVWLIGAAIAATNLTVWLEYGCMLPCSGGHKIYLEFTYRYPRFLASTLIAVQAVLLTFTTGNCVVFGQYLLFALDIEATDFNRKLFAAGLLTGIVVIHSCFLRTGIWLQNALGWVKIILIVFIAWAGIYVVLSTQRNYLGASPGLSKFSWDNLWQHSNWSLLTLSTAMFKVSYAYAGLNNVNTVLSEVKNPIPTLKLVAPAALVTAALLYLLTNIAYFCVIPLEEIKQSGELIAALFFERVFASGLGKTLLPLAIAISAAGNVMVVSFTAARLNQEIARQGFLPFSGLLSTSRPFSAPLGGFLVHYIPSFLVIILSPSDDVYSFILDVEGYPVQMITLALSIGLLVLRYRRPDLPRPFKAWTFAVWISIIFSIGLLAAPFFPPADGKGDVNFFYATYAIVGVGILTLAAIYWYFWAVLIPRWKGYVIEEEKETLDDGTCITKLVRSLR